MSSKPTKIKPKATAKIATSRSSAQSSVSGSVKISAPECAAKAIAENGILSASDALTMRAWKKTYQNRDKRVD